MPAPLAASRPGQTSEEAAVQDLGASLTAASTRHPGAQSSITALRQLDVKGRPSSSPDCTPKAGEVVGWLQSWTPPALLKDGELMPQGEDLEMQRGA